MLTAVSDVVHFRRVGEHPGGAVAEYRVALPRALPELVEHRQVFVGVVVAVVVRELIVVAHVARGRRQVAGHHVPADPALGQMVQRRQSARERIRMLESGARGDPEAEVLRRVSHCRHQQQRVVDRNLRALPDRGFVCARVDVVGA